MTKDRRGMHSAPRSPRSTPRFPLLTAFCLLFLAGCGKSGPELVPVHGRVTYGGGQWPTAGILYFTPDKPAAGLPARPARAEFGPDGSYSATSFEKGDGLIPGHYLISVECWKEPPQMGSPKPPVSYVPDKFQSGQTSGLELTIEPGSRSKEMNFDIPKP